MMAQCNCAACCQCWKRIGAKTGDIFLAYLPDGQCFALCPNCVGEKANGFGKTGEIRVFFASAPIGDCNRHRNLSLAKPGNLAFAMSLKEFQKAFGTAWGLNKQLA